MTTYSMKDHGESFRKQAALLAKTQSKRTGIKWDMAKATREAVYYRSQSLRRIDTPPLDHATLTTDNLITLCAHGAEWDIRESAAKELARRAENHT